MLNNRVALVTGGIIGVGKAIGVQLSKNRSKVALASRSPPKQRPRSTHQFQSESSLSAAAVPIRRFLDTDEGLQPRLLNRFRTRQGCYDSYMPWPNKSVKTNPPNAEYGRVGDLFQ